ncbi:hypothetical protein EVAR_75927_1 [Eumeta japonica]|uniref:CCHC-type domain-containing protein n=1 Tax=Eumeta variegata TaxID=151549 RepID=A0A4C1UY52_EUMVA|nr:hypothetical protein EVAR_75927_1 [Eumeta japonica]
MSEFFRPRCYQCEELGHLQVGCPRREKGVLSTRAVINAGNWAIFEFIVQNVTECTLVAIGDVLCMLCDPFSATSASFKVLRKDKSKGNAYALSRRPFLSACTE